MSRVALQAMKEAHEALIAALGANDIGAIEAAIASFGASAQQLRAAAEAPLDEDSAARAAELKQLSEQTQMRVNFLTDVVRRRIERLAAMRGRERVPVYAREGK